MWLWFLGFIGLNFQSSNMHPRTTYRIRHKTHSVADIQIIEPMGVLNLPWRAG
jgi:hypothetical protein